MSKIVLYEERGCRGKWKEFTDSDSNLETESFAKTARSLKVEGKHWVAYKGKDMKGDFMVYGPGEHTNLCWMDRQIMSLRLVKEELGNPEIVLYEDAAFRGQSRSIDGVVDDLRRSGFNDLVSAHEVKQGVWILYEYFNQTGRRMITFKGEKCGNYCLFNWNDRLSSLRPLLKSDHEV